MSRYGVSPSSIGVYTGNPPVLASRGRSCDREDSKRL